MLKGLGNLASLWKHAQELQGRMGEMQEQLGHLRVEGSAGGGMVKAEASGHQKILSVTIEDSVLEDREMLEDLLVSAVNQALERARETAAEEMSKMTGEMDLPGLDQALAQLGLGNGPGGPAQA